MTANHGEPDTARAAPDIAGQGRIPADTFSNRLLLARALAGHVSIREAADMTGLNRGAWDGWERGRRPRDILDVVRRIADALDVDFNWLLLGGPLAGPRGVPTKRAARPNRDYAPVASRPRDNRPSGGPTGGRRTPPTSGVSPRRPVRISAPLPVSAGQR